MLADLAGHRDFSVTDINLLLQSISEISCCRFSLSLVTRLVGSVLQLLTMNSRFRTVVGFDSKSLVIFFSSK